MMDTEKENMESRLVAVCEIVDHLERALEMARVQVHVLRERGCPRAAGEWVTAVIEPLERALERAKNLPL